MQEQVDPMVLALSYEGGSVAEWFRALDLKYRCAWFKSSTLLLSGFVLGSPEFNPSTAPLGILIY